MRYYIIDAFTDQIFKGNPAGVCVLPAWLPDEVMRDIAMENNLSETAFAVKEGERYGLRWFTPSAEVDLCGHATLATSFVLFSFYEAGPEPLEFQTRSGILKVEKKGDFMEMNFPARPPKPTEFNAEMKKAVGSVPVVAAYENYNLMLELESEEDVKTIEPDFAAVKELPYHGLIVTAKGRDSDFVSRFFAPVVGVNEDPVTGSTHTTLVPFWSERLNKKELVARQLSKRGGTLYCRNGGDRIFIAGEAALYLTGELSLR
ncbi:phenazine biosynthesis protein [Deltaproteobacteria bacterium Smac51]|nr:phenazine biosynthesis protein [Deltaproteobacteria bacterium Smac51]